MQERNESRALKKRFHFNCEKKDEGKNGFCTFSAFFYLSSFSLTRSFFNNMDTVNYWGIEKCDFYRDQANKNKKNKRTLMTGIFHRSYNFYKMPTAFIKYSTQERPFQ
jgi:hypothetical protein